MKTILFLGDSITDAGRNREDPNSLGQGYPNFAAGRLGLEHPGAYAFLNRGVSGDRVVDLYARLRRDVLNWKPDYVSILVGVNDVWHEKDFANGVSAPKYARIYEMLLEEIAEALPDTRILLMEPFVLPGTATADSWEWFSGEVASRARIVRELAAKYSLPFLPLQSGFCALAQTAPESWWLSDGVHPTPFGHQYLADQWLRIFRQTQS